MLKMAVPVMVETLREGKDKAFYADFLFLGGVVSLAVEGTIVPTLKPFVGRETVVTFEMRPKTQVLFGDRPVAMFYPVRVLSVDRVQQ